MEEMLQNFTRSGMTDVAFLIVNSKKQRSQEMFHKMNSRVSFPVYQETSEEEVWKILDGGKDDMFVYDRCGRLVAYIPFPLSTLDRSFVNDLILFAYHKDPCDGMPCNDAESQTSLEDTGNQNYTLYFLNGTDGENYEQENLTSRTNEIYVGNDVNEIWPRINETVESKSNYTFHQDHHSSGNISHSEVKSIVFKSIFNSIWGMNDSLDESNETDNNFNTFSIPDPSLEQNVENKTICNNTDNCSTAKPFHTNDINEILDITSQVKNTTQLHPKRICVAEDQKVCEQWSKRQLKRIQRCCTQIDNVLEDGDSSRKENVCKPFQKKRCKKLKTVIKCCLKIDTPDEDEENEMQSSREQGITDSPKNELHKHGDQLQAGNTMERVP